MSAITINTMLLMCVSVIYNTYTLYMLHAHTHTHTHRTEAVWFLVRLLHSPYLMRPLGPHEKPRLFSKAPFPLSRAATPTAQLVHTEVTAPSQPFLSSLGFCFHGHWLGRQTMKSRFAPRTIRPLLMCKLTSDVCCGGSRCPDRGSSPLVPSFSSFWKSHRTWTKEWGILAKESYVA